MLDEPVSPESPTSPMTRSFDLSSSTIDELTSVLTDLNRAPSPAPSEHPPRCCCGQDDCENTVSWLDLRTKLETRLILSAEVGQALLQKHEAYVRQVEKSRNKRGSLKQANLTFSSDDGDEISSEEKLSREYDLLAREKAEIEKRLNHALVNNEVTEVSNRTLMQELQEARETISRLTAHHARSMGWDARLTAALKERDDMQQERDGESHRARLAESRFAALKDKTAKLQAEVRRLQELVEEKRQHRLESSDSIIQEAKLRLQTVGLTAQAEQDELAQVMETLVNDNEVLKRDNAELQRLLAETREDVHTLQQEVEEHRAATATFPPPRSGPTTPISRHFHTGSVSSVGRRSFNADPSPRSVPFNLEPMTPDSSRRPLSPVDSLAPPDRWNGFSFSRPGAPSDASHVSYEVEETSNEEDSPEVGRSKGHRPLLLLTRSRGIQTEPWLSVPSPTATLPSHMSHLSTPPDPRSESSSLAEASHTTALFDKATQLLNKMTQADALTLTTRLKRQNLKGADLSHLSRTTVSNIIAEAIELRSQFRNLLEDEKIVVTCTRKDLRVLFKLIKDMFMEMGQMRVTLNDVIFDPACAPRVSELSLNPSKAAAEREKQSQDLASRLQGASSWIAPISKFFTGTQRREQSPTGVSRAVSGQGPQSRLAPKLGPALAASTTTVNVEFSGAGVGRATTTLAPPQMITVTPVADAQVGSTAGPPTTSVNVMNIFAGAPKPQPVEQDPWVVLPRNTPRRVQSSYFGPGGGSATIGRSAMKKTNRLSRNVDAVIDAQQHPTGYDDEAAEDEVPALPERTRTLRRRGLSDSSIHSTFTSQGRDDGPDSPTSPMAINSPVHATFQSTNPLASALHWPDRTSVFQALTKTVNNLRMTATGGMTYIGAPPAGRSTPPADSRPHSPSTFDRPTAGSSRPASVAHKPRRSSRNLG
ncbi:hypothetical protein CC2G_009975 [Coprinopsis cinerea AmutBmut pab1-1]|nr:hypothetical protein CC2G_009975 [Coprinopsis cinerea AmutBmut pab1-1]